MPENWWKGAVIYQIYPRSYCDSNHDGIGDLPGICSKLEYIADLGVDAIWISPFFKSPMHDFGYDISDYRAVDPLFGSLDDFKQLLASAHELGLKVIIDQVISHSSDQHRWFEQSRRDRDNAKADWYVWADPKDDGSPPNNWLSFFGGSAWAYEPRREQYYLHNFLTSQPDLNFHNPAVQQAQLDNLRFWLDLGVDGFRLDVVNFYYHDDQLRDNPVLEQDQKTTVGVSQANPYSRQQHIYDISRPENLVFMNTLRALLDEYPDRTTMGEINGENSMQLMAQYTEGDDKLHMAYTFDLLGAESSVEHIKNVIRHVEDGLSNGWPCWAVGNHDVARIVSRWGNNNDPHAFGLVATAMLTALHGTVCLYQGEELGLVEADIDFDDIVDPYGKPFWPEYKGRDGCRTPMPWDTSQHAGFSTSPPWLPVDPRHVEVSVYSQQSSPDSLLSNTRRLLAWRKTVPALVDGSFQLIDTPEALCWIRESSEQRVLVAFNLSSVAVNVELPTAIKTVLEGHGFTSRVVDGVIDLPAYQGFYALV